MVQAAGIGCAKKTVGSGLAGLATGVHAAIAPVSEQDAMDVVDRLVEAVDAGDKDAFGKEFDTDGLFEVAIGDMIQSGSKGIQGFIEGGKRGMAKNGGWHATAASDIITAVQGGGTIHLLRFRKLGGATSALLRITFPNSEGLNYIEFVFAKRPDGHVRIVDFYSFFAGERMSEILRRGALEVQASENRSLLDRLSGEESVLMKHSSELSQLGTAVRERKYQDAIGVYKGLPDDAKHNKLFLLAYLRAASEIGGAEYESAIEEFRKWLPEDPAADLISIDYFFNHKQYAESIAAIDRLDKAVDDPYLDVLRSGIWLEAGNLKEAARTADRYLEHKDAEEEGYWARIAVSLKTKEFDLMAYMLDDLQELFDLEFNDPASFPEYKEFWQSEAGKAWLRKQADQKQKAAAKKTSKPSL
jgi:tetratricopeptide (TPR) repeat protein